MKILSWNVNGIRAVAKKGFADFLKNQKADIVGVQEIKISNGHREKEIFDFPNYTEYWNSAERPGYAGTMILITENPQLEKRFNKHTTGIGMREFDVEGRSQTLEFDKFYLVNNYFPNAQDGLVRMEYKHRFNTAFLEYIEKLDKKKPVIFMGDLNVAHEEIDLARPKDNRLSPGFSDEERADMSMFVNAGFSDTFRTLYPDKIQYSWWSYRSIGARAKNVGWRIDYVMVSKRIMKQVKNAFILDSVLGSDHCPVGIEIDI
ncbi:MAG: exodeoxyribonuclease III [Candidatus Magasanikbacteria bacterium]|nr:exodeoxyribonuclease III [Candidatus Magasanikbacteria bacterium]